MAYLETVGGGEEAYEDTVRTLEAEMEEFSFFLSTYEFLRDRGKPELVEMVFETIAFEIRAHRWDVRDQSYLPVLNRLADLMESAREALGRDDAEATDLRVAEYRQLYQANIEHLN